MEEIIGLSILGVPGNKWVDILPPTGWTRNLPLTIQQRETEFRVNPTWKIDQNAPSGPIYYVNRTAINDLGDGLTPATAVQKLETALALGGGNGNVFYLAPGVYEWGYGQNTTNSIRKDISIRATAPGVILSQHFAGLTWVLDGVYTHTYKVTQSDVFWIWDAKYLNATGDYQLLTLQGSVADVDANPGSYIVIGGVCYIRLSDDRVPDLDVRPYHSGTPTMYFQAVTSPITVYLEGLELHGGSSCLMAKALNYDLNLYANHCAIKYASNNNGFRGLGINAYFNDCLTSCNYLDGFNGHIQGARIPQLVEISCIGHNNGILGHIADNGSSVHDGGNSVRINCEYYSNFGPNVHDISALTQSWNLGCYSYNSNYQTNYKIGDGTSISTMWIDNCRSSGSTYDIDSAANSTCYIRNFTGDTVNTGGGVITQY